MALRTVLDTNVVISGLLFTGPPHRILQFAIRRKILPVTSPVLLEELTGVLRTKFKYPASVAETVTAEWADLCERIEPITRLAAVPQDPSDNRVLECAVDGKAETVVTGDRHLLALGTFRNIPILRPQEFLDRIHL
ncbi:MAG: putative toxin-antitoxin system toxin component, PIN family [Candidatus Omnitrophota bacterium]|nr:putative toxin-antitoxin system toxin component, PIN family [Candidatus Omnitrophota bacterium]